MQSLVGTQKIRLNETLVFVYSNANFCKPLTECKINGELQLFDSILFATKLLFKCKIYFDFELLQKSAQIKARVF